MSLRTNPANPKYRPTAPSLRRKYSEALLSKLAGIVNLTAEEFAALEKEVVATSDIWSGDALTIPPKNFGLEMQHLKTDLGKRL